MKQQIIHNLLPLRGFDADVSDQNAFGIVHREENDQREEKDWSPVSALLWSKASVRLK